MKPPLFLVHGWGIGGCAWEPVLPALASRFELTVGELPGYGNHSGSFCNPTVKDLSEALLSQAPEQAAWMGWSLGGMASMQAALDQRDRITALHLVSTTPKFTRGPDWPHGIAEGQLEEFKSGIKVNIDAALDSFTTLQAGGQEGARTVVRRLRALSKAAPRPRGDALLDGLEVLRNTDLREQLKILSQPVHLVCGSNDAVVPSDASNFMLETLPNATLDLMETGHAPFVSSPDEFVQLVFNACPSAGNMA